VLRRQRHKVLSEIVIPKRSGERVLSEVEGDLLFLFCPSNLAAPDESHYPSFVIPSEVEGDLRFLFYPFNLTAPNKSHYPSLVKPSAVRREPLFLFCPSNLTAPDKSHYPSLVIPSAAEGPAVSFLSIQSDGP
jgi:hypothetical protein